MISRGATACDSLGRQSEVEMQRVGSPEGTACVGMRSPHTVAPRQFSNHKTLAIKFPEKLISEMPGHVV